MLSRSEMIDIIEQAAISHGWMLDIIKKREDIDSNEVKHAETVQELLEMVE